MIEAVLAGAVRGGSSILFAALGETVSERAGVINLSTEGSMLCGALAAYATAVETGSAWLGVLAGAAAGMALAMLFAAVVVFRAANQLATGIVVLFLALGVTSLLGRDYVGQGVDGFTRWDVPGLSDIPFVGTVLFAHDPLTYLALLAAPLVWWLMFRTTPGLMVRAAGERPEVLVATGHSPNLVRLAAVAAGGLLAGIGGAQISTALALNWSENMIQGRGFVAVALVIFAAWNPMGALAGALFFGGIESLQLQLQAEGVSVPADLLNALPYLATIAVLVLFSRRRLHAAPDGLTSVFETSP
ncbi:MAG: ABC transporter permease [Actinomycetota bacterium]